MKSNANSNSKKPWLDENGKCLSDKEIKQVSKNWSLETWDEYLSATVDVEMPEDETLHDDFETIVEEFDENIWQLPCRVPSVVKSKIESAIRGLTEHHRLIVRGLFYHNLSGGEVARTLKISRQTVHEGKLASLKNIKSLLDVDPDIVSYLIGGHEKNETFERSKDEEIREVYAMDLCGSYLK